MGRPARELTDDERAQVEALAAYLTQDQIADYLGITRPTLAAIFGRDEDVSLRYKRGKAKAIGDVASGLLKKAREGDNASMFFYLKTQAGWRETNAVEMSGPNGGPIESKDVSALDAINSRLARIAAAEETARDTSKPDDEPD